MGTSSFVPGTRFGKTVFRVEEDGQMKENAITPLVVDYDYLDVIGDGNHQRQGIRQRHGHR